MWEKLAAWVRILWNSGKQVEQNITDIKSLQEDNRKLTQLVQILANNNEQLRSELRHESEKRADELEKMELRLRLQISEELRRLPSKNE